MFLTHNLSERKLRLYLDLDGIPMPSCSVFNPDKHNFIRSYGEITFVLKQDKFLPPDREIKVFKYDGWTVRQPSPFYTYNEEKLFQTYNFLPKRYILDSLKEKQRNRRDVFKLKKIEELPLELKIDFIKKEKESFELKKFNFESLLQIFSSDLKNKVKEDFKQYLSNNPVFLKNKNIFSNDIMLSNQLLNQMVNDFFMKNDLFSEFLKRNDFFSQKQSVNKLLNELKLSFENLTHKKSLSEADKKTFFEFFSKEFLNKIFAEYLVKNEKIEIYEIDLKNSQKLLDLKINSLTDSQKKLNLYFSRLNEMLDGTYSTHLLVDKKKNQQGRIIEIFREYNMQNLVDFMKKGILKNGMINNSEGKDSDPMNISPSELKAMPVLNKEIKTLKKLREEYVKLKPQNEVFESFKDCMNDLYISLNQNTAIKKSKILEDYSEFQLFSSLVVDLNNQIKYQKLNDEKVKTNHLNFLLQQYNFNEEEQIFIKNTLYQTIEKVRELPTNYFELKIEQGIDFSDIKLAIIPENMPQNLVNQLKNKVKVIQIDVNNQELFNKTLKESNSINIVKIIKPNKSF